MNRKLPDPRVIFALAIFFSSYSVIVRELKFMSVLLFLALVFALALEVNFKRIFGRIKHLWQILIVLALVQSIFAPSGTVIFEIQGIALLTLGGIERSLVVFLRLVLLITCAAMFTLYPSRSLIQALVQIKMPYEVAYMVSVGIRFVPALMEELKDSLIALQMRGVVMEELKLRKRLGLYSYLLLPVLSACLQNAQELAMSMEMRAFRAMRERVSYFRLSLNRSDIFLLFVILLMAAICAFLLVSGII